MSNAKVIVLIGDSCTGKTYVGRKISTRLPKFTFREMSDIVKALSERDSKDGLDLLESDILEHTVLHDILKHERVILSGLREKKIHTFLRKYCDVYTVRVYVSDKLHECRIKQRDVKIEKLVRDTKYDYKQIEADFVLNNKDKDSYKQLFWMKDFCKVAGLNVVDSMY